MFLLISSTGICLSSSLGPQPEHFAQSCMHAIGSSGSSSRPISRDGRVTLLFTDEEFRYGFLRRAFTAGHEQHAEHLECVARCQTERTADEHVDLLQTGEL